MRTDSTWGRIIRTAMPLPVGIRLGPYEILALIGAGGMGEVYRARDTKLNRDVALKVLPDVLLQDSERRARFQREAQILAALNHPNVAAIYGWEDSGEAPALVMELVEGRPLRIGLPRAAAFTSSCPLDKKWFYTGRSETCCSASVNCPWVSSIIAFLGPSSPWNTP